MKSIHTLCVEVLRRVDERMKVFDGRSGRGVIPAMCHRYNERQSTVDVTNAYASLRLNALLPPSISRAVRVDTGQSCRAVRVTPASIEPKPGPKAGETISTTPAKPWRIVSAAILLSRWRWFGKRVPMNDGGAGHDSAVHDDASCWSDHVMVIGSNDTVSSLVQTSVPMSKE